MTEHENQAARQIVVSGDLEATLASAAALASTPGQKAPTAPLILPTKQGKGGQPQARFTSEEEFEAFWERLERETQAQQNGQGDQAERGERPQAEHDGPGEQAEQAERDDRLIIAANKDSDIATDREQDLDPDASLACARERLRAAIENRPLARELMRRTLEICVERQPYSDVEDRIQGFPEFACASVTPYQVIQTLIDADGLLKVEIGTDGEEVLPEQKLGLSPDEADDLVDSYALETTDLGRLVAEEMAPELRLCELFSAFADRREIFSDIMDFCRESPRTYAQIEAHLSGCDLSHIASLNPTASTPIQPSVFVDNLERAGGLVWRDGWKLTREGEALLSSLAS